ncbi:MAG: hypothetical protein ACP5FK_09255 [bacterium]
MKYEKYAIDSLIAVVESKGCQEIDLIQSTWFYNLSGQPDLSDDHENIKLYQGRSDNQQWNICLDPNSGEVWILIFYPDLSGDSP